jgi:hypothetical protein
MMSGEIVQTHRLLGRGSKNGCQGRDTSRIFVKVSIQLRGCLKTWALYGG